MNARVVARRRIRDLAEWLKVGVPSDTDVLDRVTRELAKALGTDQTFAYGLESQEQRVRLSFLKSPSSDISQIRRPIKALIEQAPADFGHYDPRSPPPNQRNIVVTLRDLRRGTGLTSSPILRLLAGYGFKTRDQLRVLICDGPLLLAWVGALRDRPFGLEDRNVLRALVRPLRDRLTLEHRLAAVPWAVAALEVVLEELGTAAVVIRRPLRLMHCNALARTLLDQDRVTFLSGLREELDGHGDGAWITTLLCSAEGARHYLALRRRPPRDTSPSAAAAGHRYGLTRRQIEVIAMVARGETNKTIAVALGCSESAVEQHVTALLRRYGVENRAQLVARFWADAG